MVVAKGKRQVQFSVLGSQFSVASSRFSVLSGQRTMDRSLVREDTVTPGSLLFELHSRSLRVPWQPAERYKVSLSGVVKTLQSPRHEETVCRSGVRVCDR